MKTFYEWAENNHPERIDEILGTATKMMPYLQKAWPALKSGVYNMATFVKERPELASQLGSMAANYALPKNKQVQNQTGHNQGYNQQGQGEQETQKYSPDQIKSWIDNPGVQSALDAIFKSMGKTPVPPTPPTTPSSPGATAPMAIR
jgi:hypothetical protein